MKTELEKLRGSSGEAEKSSNKITELLAQIKTLKLELEKEQIEKQDLISEKELLKKDRAEVVIPLVINSRVLHPSCVFIFSTCTRQVSMHALSPWYMHKAYFYVYAKATALVYSFHKLGNEASLVGIAAILLELRFIIQQYFDIVDYFGSLYS